ncbi:hypothetical protein L9F63_021607, partial [Diploptera punctata]
ICQNRWHEFYEALNCSGLSRISLKVHVHDAHRNASKKTTGAYSECAATEEKTKDQNNDRHGDDRRSQSP